jgi:hypothetical protein
MPLKGHVKMRIAFITCYDLAWLFWEMLDAMTGSYVLMERCKKQRKAKQRMLKRIKISYGVQLMVNNN